VTVEEGAGAGVGVGFAAAAAAFFFWKHKDLERIRQNTRTTVEQERDQAGRILKACMAELADFRRELSAEDAKSQKVTEFLQSLSSPEFVLQRPEQARATVA